MGETYPATDWGTYDLPAIAAMLTDTNQDSWDQVSAWRTTAETLEAHQAAMARAITQLAQTWPPDHSPAAAEFIDYAQALRTSIAQTAQAAYANSTALSNALIALENAQSRIDRLYQTWQQLPTETTGDAQGQILTTRLEKTILNTTARQVMQETDQIILESARRLQVPPVMETPDWLSTTGQPITSTESGGTGGTGATTGSRPAATAGPQLYSGSGPASGGRSLESRAPVPAPITGQDSDLSAAEGGSDSAESITTATPDLAPDSDELLPIGDSQAPYIDRIRSISLGSRTTAPSVGLASSPDTVNRSSSPASPDSEGATKTLQPAEPLEPVSAGFPLGFSAPTGNRRPRRRLGRAVGSVGQGSRVPGLITPQDEPEYVHDPGPSVIGIDR